MLARLNKLLNSLRHLIGVESCPVPTPEDSFQRIHRMIRHVRQLHRAVKCNLSATHQGRHKGKPDTAQVSDDTQPAVTAVRLKIPKASKERYSQ